MRFLFPTLKKMSPRDRSSVLHLDKGKKRKKLLMLQVALKAINGLTKKLWDLNLTESKDYYLPFKKRKISYEDSEISCVVSNRKPAIIFDSENFETFYGSRPPDLSVTKLPSSRINSLRRISQHSRNATEVRKTRNEWNLIDRICKMVQEEEDMNVGNLLRLFENCVNFNRPRGYTPITDIDLVVRSFSDFGKVLSIQDHWVQTEQGSGEKYVWVGAMVTYKYTEDFNRAIKAMSIRKTPLIAVSVVEHLSGLHFMESKWESKYKDYSSQGTTIVLEGITDKVSHYKLENDLANYGVILNLKTDGNKKLGKSWKVTYKSTVSAVAAALALDGKKIHKCCLRTKIKMCEKEIFIHKQLCSIF